MSTTKADENEEIGVGYGRQSAICPLCGEEVPLLPNHLRDDH